MGCKTKFYFNKSKKYIIKRKIGNAGDTYKLKRYFWYPAVIKREYDDGSISRIRPVFGLIEKNPYTDTYGTTFFDHKNNKMETKSFKKYRDARKYVLNKGLKNTDYVLSKIEKNKKDWDW